MAMVPMAWQENTLPSSLGCGPAHETFRQLQYANSDTTVLRRWKRLNKNLSRKVFSQILEQQDARLALIVYTAFKDEPWLKDKTGDVAAVLCKAGMETQADSLIFNRRLLSPSDRLKFGCSLLKSYAKNGLWEKALNEFQVLQALEVSPVAKEKARRMLLFSQAENRDPIEAEATLRKMQAGKVKVTPDSYKAVLFSYGKCGLITDMERLFEEMRVDAGFKLDAVTCTMMLVAYGIHGRHQRMLGVLEMMQTSGIQVCVRSWNALSNACPAVVSEAFESGTVLDHVLEAANDAGEVDVVRAMLRLKLPSGVVKWSDDCWTLDLHGMSVRASFIALCCWFRSMKGRFCDHGAPVEVEVVTGWGKHSSIEGNSEVKTAVSSYLRKLMSPFRVDRLNKGRMVCKGERFKEWLHCLGRLPDDLLTKTLSIS